MMARILFMTAHALPGTVLVISKHSLSQHLLNKLRLLFQSTQHTIWIHIVPVPIFISTLEQNLQKLGSQKREEDQHARRDVLILAGPFRH